MRAPLPSLLVISLALAALVGCDQPRVVDCETGLFAQADDDGWCVYRASDASRCPRLVPVEHRLPGGGRGCATRMHDPVPASLLCEVSGTCPSDAGAGG